MRRLFVFGPSVGDFKTGCQKNWLGNMREAEGKLRTADGRRWLKLDEGRGPSVDSQNSDGDCTAEALGKLWARYAEYAEGEN